jgi:hypothetical protein
MIKGPVEQHRDSALSGLAMAIVRSRNFLGFRFITVKDLQEMQRQIVNGEDLTDIMLDRAPHYGKKKS